MPKHSYERREPTHNWQEIRPLLKDPAQITYEIIRPVILWGQTPKEHGWESDEVEWHVIMRTNPPVRRRKQRGRVFMMQPPLFVEKDGTQS